MPSKEYVTLLYDAHDTRVSVVSSISGAYSRRAYTAGTSCTHCERLYRGAIAGSIGRGTHPRLVINGNTNLESHRALFNLNAFCSWRHAREPARLFSFLRYLCTLHTTLPVISPSRPVFSPSPNHRRPRTRSTSSSFFLARSLLCFYSRWMSQSLRPLHPAA